MKVCTKCGVEKPNEFFRKKQVYQTKSGPKVVINNLCHPCVVQSAKESKERNPYTWIALKFNLTKEEAKFWHEKSQTACELCGIERQYLKAALCIDHDHTTGKVRGVLCKHCNHVLGHSRDNIEVLEKAIEYLRRAG